jgi:hypothetical protein
VKIVADLTFEVVPDGTARGEDPAPVRGRVLAGGSVVTVDFSRTPSLAGTGTRPLVRPLAHTLDEHGLTVRLTGPSGTLLRLGHGVRAPWWQVPATSSRRIEVTSVPLALRSLRGPRLFAAALPPLLAQPGALRLSRRRRALAVVRQVLRRVTDRRR